MTSIMVLMKRTGTYNDKYTGTYEMYTDTYIDTIMVLLMTSILVLMKRIQVRIIHV